MGGSTNERNRKRNSSYKLITENQNEKCVSDAKNTKKLRKPASNEEEKNPCHVCGEKARCYNFGGMSCNCCKSFFRHFVLKNLKDKSEKDFKKNCKFKGDCLIDQKTRKKCKACRFLKCCKIGMDFKWVLADYKKTQDLKLQKLKINQIEKKELVPPIIEKSNDAKLNSEDATRIENILKFYKSACEQIPYMFPSREKNEVVSPTKSKILLIGFISTSIRRFVYFAKMIPEFAKLSVHDQTNLLRRSGIHMGMLRGSIIFDFDRGLISSKDGENYPEISVAELQDTCPQDLFEMHKKLYRRIRDIAPDETSIMLMIPVVLFSDCGGTDSCTEFDDKPAINEAQEFYSGLLEKYVKFVQGEKGRLTFPKLLSQLVELTQICQLHQGLPLNLTEHQVDKMHLHLLKLQRKSNISPPVPNKNPAGEISPEQNQLKQYCQGTCKESLIPGIPSSKVNTPARNSEAFQLLIRTFVNTTGEWGIKPAYFVRGPHIGIKQAFMRRIPELLACPWDCLVNEGESGGPPDLR